MFTWSILDLFADGEKLISVRYLLTATDDINTVSSEGNHVFSNGLINKPLSLISEKEILNWLDQDTTQDGVNSIKSTIEDQLKSLGTSQKVDFPWLAGTFTIE